MVERLDVDLWVPRTVALALVGIATKCDGVGAESYLIEYLSRHPATDWRYRPWGAQIVAAMEGARVDQSFFAESTRAMQIRFWPEAHAPRPGVLIHVRGNEAIYRGPLQWLPVWVEVSSPKGVIIPRNSPLVIPNSLTVIDTRWQTEVHLGAIRLRLRPLLEALRREDGLVDLAIGRLVKQGLLPAALSGVSDSPSSPTHGSHSTPAKRRNTLEARYEAALGKDLRGKMKSEWAKEMAERHGWNPGHVQNWLARPEIDELWRDFGGLATSPNMRGSRQPNG